MVHEVANLKSLCVAQMRKVWETSINSKGPAFPFLELCKQRLEYCDGRLDRNGFISFQDYVDCTGTVHQFLEVLKPSISFNMCFPSAGVKGTAWAWEPEI